MIVCLSETLCYENMEQLQFPIEKLEFACKTTPHTQYNMVTKYSLHKSWKYTENLMYMFKCTCAHILQVISQSSVQLCPF